MIGLIVATDKNGLIGYDNTIPWSAPADLKRFRQVTLDSTVVMGRKTFQSIGRCLPKRDNIVITSDSSQIGEVNPSPLFCKNLEEALRLSDESKNIWIIGGSQLYQAALSLVDVIDHTLVNVDFVVEDESKAVYFKWDKEGWNKQWEVVNKDDPNLTHIRYARIK